MNKTMKKLEEILDTQRAICNFLCEAEELTEKMESRAKEWKIKNAKKELEEANSIHEKAYWQGVLNTLEANR